MKKRKRALTKQERDAILKSLSLDSTAASQPVTSSNETPVSEQLKQKIDKSTLFDETTTPQELKKIAVIVSILVILLLAATIADQKTNYLANLATKITQSAGF